jgi:hypothetical protein
VAAELLRHGADCPGAGEGVEDGITHAGAGEDAARRERRREGGEMALRRRLGRERPDRAEVALTAIAGGDRPYSTRRIACAIPDSLTPVIARRCGESISSRLPHRVGVVEVARRLRQEKDVLVRLGRPVGHALGHGVRLRPDDV